ncbi:hypothetical protein ACNKHT_03695 [Shigella flexneri]
MIYQNDDLRIKEIERVTSCCRIAGKIPPATENAANTLPMPEKQSIDPERS